MLPEQQLRDQLAETLEKIGRQQADTGRAAAELREAQRQIAALHGVIARLGSDVRARESQELEAARCTAEEALHGQARLQARLDAVLRSRSWRLTAPVRAVGRLLRSAVACLRNG